MISTLAIRRRKSNAKRGIGTPGNNSRILTVARRLREIVDAPVLGGIAVYLHGGGRSTVDLDLYATDSQLTSAQLSQAGARLDRAKREHVLDGVQIHIVPARETGVAIQRTSIIDGVRVVSLKDLISI